jgi:hypothetical protein
MCSHVYQKEVLLFVPEAVLLCMRELAMKIYQDGLFPSA